MKTVKVSQVLSNPSEFDHLKKNARKTIVSNYDLKKVALPKQINLVNTMLGIK